MSEIIKWGIIAPGGIAKKFASDLKLVPNAELYGIASRKAERAMAFAKEYGATRSYNSYQELVEDENIDVVYIASPHTFHYEQTMLCLNNGKHVLCEKPMGMNAREVAEMSKLAKEKSLFLMEAFWTQFHPSFKRCLELVENNSLGDIHSLSADFGFTAENNPESRLLNKKLGGGALLDIGIYPVFFAISIMGKPSKIKASGIIGETGVDLSNSMIFENSTMNCLANLSSTLIANTPVEAIVAGTKGYIRLNSQWHCPTSLQIVINGKETIESFEEKGFGYEHEAIEVTNCLLEGRTESKLLTLDKSLLLHTTLDEVRQQIGLSY